MNHGRQTIAFVLATVLTAQAGLKIVAIDPPEKDFFFSPSRASTKLSEVSSFTAYAHP